MRAQHSKGLARLGRELGPHVEENLALHVGRQCHLKPYRKVAVPAFEIAGEFVTYASPESTYAVTKRFFDQARRTIQIGIYDFTAGHIKELVLNAMGRGVRVSLMLDIDSEAERRLFTDLARHGCEAVPAPSCASDRAHYFASSHEKVIVIDDTWTLVQSGNYSNNSSPLNETDGGDRSHFVPGNRDTGIAVESKPLARFLSRVLRSDMTLELRGKAGARSALGTERDLSDVAVLTRAPARVPPKLFPSASFQLNTPIHVQPVLSPDNYLDVVPAFIGEARESVWIEQQYIRSGQPQVQKLLQTIATTRQNRPGLDVRIILARPLARGRDFEKAVAEIGALEQFGLRLGKEVRILNPDYFVHCHNKLLVVDARRVLVSSQNWSDAALMKNREAGLILSHPKLAGYYGAIFEADWVTGLKKLTAAAAAELLPAAALNSGQRLVRLDWGDYAEV